MEGGRSEGSGIIGELLVGTEPLFPMMLFEHSEWVVKEDAIDVRFLNDFGWLDKISDCSCCL